MSPAKRVHARTIQCINAVGNRSSAPLETGLHFPTACGSVESPQNQAERGDEAHVVCHQFMLWPPPRLRLTWWKWFTGTRLPSRLNRDPSRPHLLSPLQTVQINPFQHRHWNCSISPGRFDMSGRKGQEWATAKRGTVVSSVNARLPKAKGDCTAANLLFRYYWRRVKRAFLPGKGRRRPKKTQP